MSTSATEPPPLAQEARCTEDELIVSLVDGRVISIPLEWFPGLAQATPGQLSNHEFLGEGQGIRWPDLDEDVSVAGLLREAH